MAHSPWRPTAIGTPLEGTLDRHPESQDRHWSLLFLSWLLVTTAAAGSLFFSEVMDLPPCSLCWVQRAFMFPLVIVLFAGLFPFEPKTVRFALPLAGVGWAVATYHVLLTWGVIPESAAPCTEGVSCSEVEWALLGVLSIPVLSWLVFTAVAALLLGLRRRLAG